MCGCRECRDRAKEEWRGTQRLKSKRARTYQVRMSEGSKVRRESEFARAAAAAKAERAAEEVAQDEGDGGDGEAAAEEENVEERGGLRAGEEERGGE